MNEVQSEGAMPTNEKFAAYEEANLAGGGEKSHELWASFTPKERKLWGEQSGSLIQIPGATEQKLKI